MKYNKTRLNIIISILVVVSIAVFFIWAIRRNPEKIYEGAVSESDILTIVDVDLCNSNDKCISSSAKQRVMSELTAMIYDNNLEIDKLTPQKVGLSDTDMPKGEWTLTIHYMYGPVSGSTSADGSTSASGSTSPSISPSANKNTVIVKENESINLENYKKGPLKIKKAEYYYTDTRDKSGTLYGQKYYLKESEGLVDKLNARIKNNMLKIDKISPRTLGVTDPYYYAPNTVKGADHAENTLEITYAYGDYKSNKITAIDGDNIITKLPVSD
jgi:hypothetical protein